MSEELEQQLEQLEKESWTKEEVESIKSELSDKYLRLYAEFENFKKRTQKEKEDIKNTVKMNTLSAVLDIDNDISIAYNKLGDLEKSGVSLIKSKLDKFLVSQGIESIQTDQYDIDLHEAISVLSDGATKIIDVVSKGYKIGGNILRHPKVILG